MTDCEDEDDMSRSQSPMIPLTIENSVIKIKSEPGDEAEADYLEAAGHEDAEDEEEEEELLNSSLTAMDWLPKLNARAGGVEEFVPEEERKPPYSYASLIRLAILSSPGQRATLADIYKWIQDQFLYYRNQTNLGWKNSIRHNLSLNKCFMKVARSRHDPGKGCYWAINQLYSQDEALPFEKRKKVVMLPSEALRADMTLQQPRQPLCGVRLPQLEAVRHPHPVPKQRESTRQIFFHVYKYFPRFNTQHRVVQWCCSPSTRARTPPPTPPSRATAAASQTSRGCPRPAATTASARG